MEINERQDCECISLMKPIELLIKYVLNDLCTD